MKPSLSGLQQRSLVEAVYRLNLWHGAIRSGKTMASILAWLNFVAQGPPGKLLMSGKTLETLERNVIDPMADLFPARLRADAVAHTRGANTATIFGRLVHLVGANDAKAEGRIRGLTLAGAYVDEASLVPEGFWQQLTGRLSIPGAKLFATTNPDSPNHWLKRSLIDRAGEMNALIPGHVGVWHFKLTDNPALDPVYVASIRAEYLGLWRLRYIEGLWVMAEGAIYGMWDEEAYCEAAVAPVRRQWVGIDYGTASSAFVALLMGMGADNRVHVLSEYRWEPLAMARRKTDAEYSADVRAWLRAEQAEPEFTFVDPSASSFMEQLWRDDRSLGIRLADNAVLDGLRVCASALGSDRVRVHRSCSGLISEFPGYVWDPAKQARGEDAPLKMNDHGLDAFRYAMLGMAHVWQRLPVSVAA